MMVRRGDLASEERRNMGDAIAFETTRRSKNSRSLKPFDQLPIYPAQYGRYSVVDVPRRYPLDATLDQILQNASVATVNSNGQLIYRNDTGVDSIILDCSFVLPANIEYSMYQLENLRDIVYSITVSESASLLVRGVEKLLSEVLIKGRFNFLVELDISYVSVSHTALESLCRFVYPVTAGYCPLRRLRATRCGLGAKGTTALLTALKQNTVIEVILITGNAATDSVIPSLIQFLNFNGNAVSVLGLGDNLITADGMARLAVGMTKHLKLIDLQLNSNSIEDDGADSIFSAICNRKNFESLNLNNCGIANCSWALKLSSLLSLSSLFLSHNCVDDQGLLALSIGLRDACCLRYLDLSYNMFGMTPGAGLSLGSLGSIIKVNRMLTVLVLSGNCMLQASWSSVAAGLFENESLMSLDVTYCELTLLSAESLCRALEVNQTVSIDMRYNNVPDTMLSDPRCYHNAQVGALRINPKQLYRNVQAVSLLSSQEWRVKRFEEVKLEKTAADVIQEQVKTSSLQAAAGELDDFDDLSLFNVSGSVLPPSTFGPEFSAAGFGHGYSVHSNNLLTAHGLPPPQRVPEPMSSDRILTVTYGHVSTVLGVVVVRDDTTYTQAKELVKPLVRAYLGINRILSNVTEASVGDSSEPAKDYARTARPCRDYAEDFVLLTPAGQTIAPNLARVSHKIFTPAHPNYTT